MESLHRLFMSAGPEVGWMPRLACGYFPHPFNSFTSIIILENFYPINFGVGFGLMFYLG
jgi:hypothetical protein